jgi:hypothetical protein
MASMSRSAVDGRANSLERRFRLASPTTALVLGVLTLLLEAADVPLATQIHTLSFGNYGFELVFILPFLLVGVVVARREPRNPMGWLLMAVSLVEVLAQDAADYGVFVYRFGHRAWPLGPLAVLLDLSFAAGLLLMPLVLILFPDGRLGSRWKLVLRGSLVLYVVYLAGQLSIAAVALGRRVPVWGDGSVVGANHPNGLASWVTVAKPITLPLFALLCVASVLRQLVIYRRSTGVRRQQLKWLGAGGGWCVVALLILVSNLANSAPTAVWIFIILGWTALPLSIGVGILRYRLYERPARQPHALLRDPHRPAARHLHRPDRVDYEHARILWARRRRRLHARGRRALQPAAPARPASCRPTLQPGTL